ncbi:MAG: alpha/beta hydrolase [Bacteroidetes bacterium]|nr:alpha/beta hydrolase [Bacteroidota bacterium]
MRTFLLFALIFSVCLAKGQNFVGSWGGNIQVGQLTLLIKFHIENKSGTYKVALDVPQQGAKGIKADSVFIDKNQFDIIFNALHAKYSGELEKSDQITGVFSQAGQNLSLNLHRIIESERTKKGIDSTKTILNYIEREVSFYNEKDDINLKGTLNLPKTGSHFPAVILISGSGPQNKDGEILGHKPFKVIAEHLSQNGIAVLRYDERGVENSEGDFGKATSFDFSQDAESALNFLKSIPEIDPKKIGYLGHSEGGIIAPMIANRNKDVNFLILLAGPTLPGDDILFLQQRKINKILGVTDSEIERTVNFNKKTFELIKTETEDELKLKLQTLFEEELHNQPINLPAGMDKDQYINLQINQLTSVWFKNFISYDPRDALRNVNCKTLALFGEIDLQVPATENAESLKKIVESGNKTNFEVKILASHNHLFQRAETGSPTEYGSIKHAISDETLETIRSWIWLLSN